MPNEIIVRVRVIPDEANAAIHTRLRAEAGKLGDDMAVDINEHITDRLERETQAASGGSGGYARIGDRIGETIGEHVSERITEKIKVDVSERLRDDRGRFTSRDRVTVRDRETVHVDVDVNRQSFMQKLAGFGNDIKSKVSSFFSGGITQGVSAVFSGDILSTIIKAGLIAFATATLAPVIGIAITGGILAALGGGVLAAGVIAAFQDPKIKAAAAGLKNDIAPVIADFGENFKGPILNFIEGLKGVIGQVTPMIEHLGRVFGPVADVVGRGLIGMLQNMLPGILRAMEAAAPVIEEIGQSLPSLGDHIGRFFDHIKKNGPVAAEFFNDLIHVIEVVIDVLGNLIDVLSQMYKITRLVISAMIQMFMAWAGAVLGAARIAFGWIPGLGPKIDRAAEKFAAFRNKVNKYLDGIQDRDVAIRMHAVLTGVTGAAGQAFRYLYGKAAGGVASGIAHAATGGSRSGLTMVGEHGPELIDAAPGSRVYSNADSLRMAGQQNSGQQGPTIINLILDGFTLARVMADPMRKYVNDTYGGSVQAAYGR